MIANIFIGIIVGGLYVFVILMCFCPSEMRELFRKKTKEKIK